MRASRARAVRAERGNLWRPDQSGAPRPGGDVNKILLVGGAGYVGSVLARELLDRGYAVKVLDRLYYGAEGLEDVRDRLELITGDMRNLSDELLHDVAVVVNVGGLSNDPTAEF